ncbi:MAG TPA: hypothetical protein VMM78_16860 [Thermomicrobiales bacterium]|nr:hypothetical protein [Thermomicrobiales bacterium]
MTTMATHHTAQTLANSEPPRGTLDAAWPRTPVAHLAFETDTHFATIHCPRS